MPAIREVNERDPVPLLQSMRFDRGKWTPAKAQKWMRETGTVPIKPADVSRQWLRYRIRPPVKGAQYVTMTDDNLGMQLIGTLTR